MADQESLNVLIHASRGTTPRPEEWKKHRSTLEKIDLSKADLSNQKLRGFDLSGADLAGASFENADLSGALLEGARLNYANLKRANLVETNFTSAEMMGCNFESANLVETNCNMANMKNCRLNGAYIAGGSFVETDLSGANLSNAKVKFCSMGTADLTDVDVADAHFTGMHISDEMIASAKNFTQAVVVTKEMERLNLTGRKEIPVEEDHEDLFFEEDASKILGVTQSAPIEDIEKAYRKRAAEYHPDKVVHLGEKIRIVAAREFERIQQAYISLSKRRTKDFVDVGDNGIELLAKRRPEEVSLEEYLRLAVKCPNNDKVFYNLGTKYMHLGLAEMAGKAFKQAISINPENEFARYNLRIVELFKALGE